MSEQGTEPKGKKVLLLGTSALLLVVILALILGLIGGMIAGQLFVKSGRDGATGEQGVQGIQGIQGPQGYNGSQGIQGEPGLNGTNTIQQVLQSQNATAASLGAYNATEWYNMSVFDSSMHLTISVNDQSRILAEFATSVSSTNSAVWLKIVVDNQNSTVCYVGMLGPNSPNTYLPAQVKILTGALSAGQHTIDVQFYRFSGLPTLMDRSLYVTELPPP